VTESPTKSVAILGGGGIMGQGIAMACLIGGHRVSIVSSKQATVSRGIDQIADGRYGLRAAARRGKLQADRVEQLLAMLSGTTNLEEGVAGADFVFESVPEDRQLKCEVLAAAESATGAQTVLASNTSSIMIAELSGSLVDPSRLIGTHWFYPANVMKLVEIGRSELTSEVTYAATLGFIRDLGKRAVVVGDSPGFFMTRFVNVWVSEAIRLVELGVAGPAEIDEMVKSGLGWPMGVFELLDDTASFESWYHAQEYLHDTLGDRYAVPTLARKVLSAGYLGDPKLKPGSRGGWYDFLGITRPVSREDV
jgi:3-hydroxybutyryl-CoA dehydrogenase